MVCVVAVVVVRLRGAENTEQTALATFVCCFV